MKLEVDLSGSSHTYPPDPINDFDLTGQWKTPGWIHSSGKWVGRNSESIGVGLAAISVGVCIAATAGVCVAAAASIALANGAVTTAGARSKGKSWGRSLAQGGIEMGLGLIGASKIKAVRSFGNNRNYGTVSKAMSKAPGQQRVRNLRNDFTKGLVYGKARDYAWSKSKWR